MKTNSWLALALTMMSLCVYGQVAVSPTAVDTVVVERGPHHVVLQDVKLSADDLGQPVAVTNSFVQLTPGLSWFNPQSQQWEATLEQFQITKEGYAVALQGPHLAILKPNAASPDAVTLVAPDGKRFISHVYGISYFDPISGNSALIAEVKDSIGELVAPNQVIYPNAFTDFQADVRVTYTKGGFEQDIILREQPPAPDKFGLPETSQLQILTEFIDPPKPVDRASATNAEPNRFLIAPNLTDERLNFGAMVLGQGKAFSLDEADSLSGFAVSDDKAVPVGKTWTELAPGRQFLVESVNAESIRPALELLPAAPEADAAKSPKKLGRMAELIRERPLRVAALSRGNDKTVQVARLTPRPRRGLNIDYQILNTISNQTLKSDTTYYLTNTCVLSGLTVIEGGTVVKYTNGAQLKIQGTLKCLASPYRPAVFTSKDSDEVGEMITGSTGNPATNYAAATALYLDDNQSDLKYIRIAHADQAIYYDSDTGYPHYLSHAQLVHCRKGVMPHNTTFFVRNVLMNDVLTNFYNTASSATGHVEHLTVNVANYLNGSTNITLNVTNSLLVAVTNIGTISGAFNATNSNGSGVFQSVGAANHYLSSGSPYRNIGMTNISYQLAADLARLTTYPPILLTNDFTVSTILSPQAQRDSDIPDLGVHYPPLDYCWSGLNLTNGATLTLTNSVAVGIYGAKGTVLRANAKFVSEGTPVDLNRLVRYQTVQEQSFVWGTNAAGMALLELNGENSSLQILLRHTEVSLMADTHGRRTLAILANGYDLVNPFAIVDSRLRGIYQSFSDSFSSGRVIAWTNNLLDRCVLYWTQSDSIYYPFTLYLYNNLFYKGTNSFTTTSNTPSWTVKDNLFDSDSLTKTGSPTFTASNNGYRSGLTSLGGTGNKTNLVMDYQPGPLGEFYYPISGTNLYSLVNAGSRTNSGLAGLYHHTTTVDQIKETNSVLDIGFHYLAVNPAEAEIPKLSPMYPDASSSYDGTWTPDKATNGSLADVGWHNLTYTEEPAWLRIDLGSSKNVTRVGYTGRQGTGQGVGSGNGVYRDYKIYVTDNSSTNSANWGTEVAAGQWLWQNGQERRDVGFNPKSGRYVIFRRITADGDHGPSGNDPGYANANEVWIYARNNLFSTPLDSDVDGLPDYFEDRNGNGVTDTGETNWQDQNDFGLKVWITEPKSNSNIP